MCLNCSNPLRKKRCLEKKSKPVKDCPNGKECGGVFRSMRVQSPKVSKRSASCTPFIAAVKKDKDRAQFTNDCNCISEMTNAGGKLQKIGEKNISPNHKEETYGNHVNAMKKLGCTLLVGLGHGCPILLQHFLKCPKFPVSTSVSTVTCFHLFIEI